MKIETVEVRVFTHTTRKSRDIDGHTHPGPAREARSALLTITCDDGTQGFSIGHPELLRPHLLDTFIRPTLLGEDPFLREKLWLALTHWQRGSTGQLSDATVALVEMALWDLAGRALGQPVWRLIGGFRDKVPAYGSTMCGDEIPGGLATPEDYGRFAEQLAARGYQAIKLHTWMPPVSFAPSVAMDIKACAAVREAVGPTVPLMLDANHWYSRTEALELGRALEQLNYYWFEEMMEESSTSSYRWLAEQLAIPILGPESAGGRFHTRAEWIRAGACDILRTGVHDVGGITPSLKICHLAESFNMDCEIHGNGIENLTVLASMHNGRWYERGLLHPHYDYDAVPEYLNAQPDPMDADGFVHLPTRPGLGYDLNLSWIEAHTVD